MPDTLLESPVLVTIITIGASAITGFMTWLFGRRRSETEIAKIAAETYTIMISDLRDEVNDLRSTLNEQEQKIERRDNKLEKIMIYVEKLEDLLIASNIIKREQLEAIKVEIGV